MPIFQEKARILKNQRVAQGVWEMRLQAPQIASAAYPGQFAMFRVRDELSPLLRRPFSFSRLNTADGTFDILYKVVGQGTRIMSSFAPGNYLDILGPLGRGFRLPPKHAREIWFLAGGIGIAPFFGLLDMLRQHEIGFNITLFYGAATGEELVRCEFFEQNNCTVNICTDDGTCGFHGFITDSVERTCTLTSVPDYFYSCGPHPMQQRVMEWAKCNNLQGQMSMETMMACGVGVCLGCSISKNFFAGEQKIETGYLRVCREGPVFTIGDKT